MGIKKKAHKVKINVNFNVNPNPFLKLYIQYSRYYVNTPSDYCTALRCPYINLETKISEWTCLLNSGGIVEGFIELDHGTSFFFF